MNASENQIVVYQSNETVRLDVRLENEVKTKEPPLQSIFYQNKFWDAKSLLIKFIRRAKKELIVIDAYPGVATLDMLAKRGRGGSSLGHRSIYSKNIYRRGRPFC